MDKHGLDAVVCRYTENVLYFTNVWPVTGWGFAIVQRDEPDATLFLPSSEMDLTSRAITGDIRPYDDTSLAGVRRLLGQVDLAGKRVGLELSKEGLASSHLGYEVAFPNAPTFEMIKDAFPSATLLDATLAIDEMRACKTDLDLKNLRLVNELNFYGLEAAAELLHVDGLSEMNVATECEKAIMDRIGEHPSIDFIRAFAFVMAGPNGIKASRPFNISTAYKIKKGEYVMLELNTQVNGYWSDLTRTWVCGRRPTAEQSAQHDAVCGAVSAALAVMKPGNAWRQAFDASRDCIERAGFSKYHTDFLGHGIGVKLHELVPMMKADSDPAGRFEAGHYCSVEPGLYIENMGALRYERNVAVMPGGVEIFDEFPCSL